MLAAGEGGLQQLVIAACFVQVMMIIEGELEAQKQLITKENAENARPPPIRSLLLQQQPGCSDSRVPSFSKIVTKSMARGHLVRLLLQVSD